LLEPVKDPLGDLVSRWARTHGPFRAEDLASRWGIGVAVVREALERLASQERVLEGEFLPNGRGREWVDAEVLKGLKRRALAKPRRAHRAVPHGPLSAARAAPEESGRRALREAPPGAAQARRLVLRRPDGGDRRIPRRSPEGAVGPGLGRRGHERYARAAPIVPARAAEGRSPHAASRASLPLA